MANLVLIGRILRGSLPATSLPYESIGGNLNQFYTPDLDGDGASDLLVLSGSFPSSGSGLPQPGWVAFGDGRGGFLPVNEARFPGIQTVHAREVAFADFNSDGHLDVFIADHGYDAAPFAGAQNRLYLSNGNGTWRDATANLPQQIDFTHSVSVGDIDDNGHLDIIVGNSALPSYLYVPTGDGTGLFTQSFQFLPTDRGELLDPTRRNALSSTVADLDNDGFADLVLGTGTPNPDRIPAQVLWSDRGRFDSPVVTNLPWPAYLSSEVLSPLGHDIQTLDVDFDGDLDLILAWAREVGREGFELQVLVNNGQRGFEDRTATYIPDISARDSRASGDIHWIQFLVPTDLNGDGRTDFVIDARRQGSVPEIPMALVHQPEGHFEVFRQSDAPWKLYGWSSWVYWPGSSGFAAVASSPFRHVALDTYELTFIAPATHWVGGSRTADRLIGTTGGDELAGFGSNDYIDGAAGTDLASFLGKSSDYLVTFDALSSTHSIKDAVTSRDGIDKLTSIELLKFSDGTKQLATTDALLVGRIYQSLFGEAPSSATFNETLAKLGPSDSAFEWANAKASSLSALSNSAFSTLVLNNMSITNKSLIATSTFGTSQQAYDGLQQALTDYLSAVGSANRGIVVAQLAQIIAGFEGETTFGVYGAAATAFNRQVSSNLAHSINSQNTSEVVVVPVMGTGSSTASTDNFSYMLAMSPTAV